MIDTQTSDIYLYTIFIYICYYIVRSLQIQSRVSVLEEKKDPNEYSRLTQ